ncbi:MAG: nucleotidyltransferase domain-containing protein [Thermoplasmata archaeon]
MIDPHGTALLKLLRRGGAARFSTLRSAVRNPRTLSSRLKALQRLGWVEKAEGAYRITTRGERAADLLRGLEVLMEPEPAVDVTRVPHPYFPPVLKALTEALLRRFGENLRGVLLFGSVARGDWTKDSDIDLLVLLQEYPTDRVGVVADLLAVRKALRRTPEYQQAYRAGFVPTVEFHPLDREDASRFRRLYLEALTEGVILLDRGGHLADLLRRFRERLREAGGKRVEARDQGHYWVLEDPGVLGAPL